jgi:amino acid adenylation domain-containing protein
VTTRLETLVIDAARRHPQGVAITDPHETWTYRELHDWSDRLAACFADLGVRPGDRVAVRAPKSCRAVAAFQAVLRLGAAYVPIDPAMPAARARKILDDCDVRLIVTTRALDASLAFERAQFFVDDPEAWRALSTIDAGQPDCQPDWQPVCRGADDLAYILYTSGSTGMPKGVCISHRNALAFVEWAIEAVGVTRPEMFANHASFNFDLSVFDLYGAFLSLGTVCLIPESIAYAASRLVQVIQEQQIGVWYSVPSVLMLMMDHGGLLEVEQPPAVVIFAGEPFPIRYVRTLRARWPRARMFNFYGPTETNVCTSYEVVDIPDDQVVPVPIGSAASGDRVWAITDEGTVAQAGERGELHVDGPTVMLGYWGAERQRGPYPTGDICVRQPDGHYAFVGRRDHMVKCRGHRVEPGEIEAALSQHPNVREVAIAAMGEGVDQRLVAFVSARQGGAPSLIELKAFGARYLPRYMLVDQVQELDALPRTPNGKIDRLALLHPFSSHPVR